MLIAVLVIDLVLAFGSGYLILTLYNDSTMHPIHIYSTCSSGSIAAIYGNDKVTYFAGGVVATGVVYIQNHGNLTLVVDKNIGCTVISWSLNGGGKYNSTSVTNDSYIFFMGDITGGGSIVAIATTGNVGNA